MATENKIKVSALYDDDDVLLKGVKIVKERGFHIHEVFTPFPVHGLDEAMGLRRTRIAIACFIYGCMGLTFAIVMTWYMLNHDWPMNIGGKPSFTWGENMPAFVPLMFELTVFFSAHLMVWTFFFRNGLYPGRKPGNPDKRTTDDKFLMEVELVGEKDELIQILRETGAIEISDSEIIKAS